MKHPIPLDIFEQHAVALGKTGSGKSYAMAGIIAMMLESKKRVCVIDPKGDHYGLKLGADGKSAGFPIVLFGDFKNPKASDVRINERSGKEIGELVVTGNRPCVIGMRGWMPSAMTRFWIDFAGAIFNRIDSPLYLSIDEVHNFAPKGKILSPEAGMCLHWSNRIGSEGRGIGIRLLIASQRPQKVHNDLLTCCETLIAMRCTHPSDKAATHEWLKEYSDDNERGRLVLNSLSIMKRGEAFVWSPEAEFFERITFPKIFTFDSYASPKEGKQQKLEGWAEVDLGEIQSRLAQVIEEHKANDPSELRREIAELKRQLTQRKPQQAIDAVQLETLRQKYQALLSLVLNYEKAVHGYLDTVRKSISLPIPQIQLNGLAKIEIPKVVKSEPVMREKSAMEAYDQRVLDMFATLQTRGIAATRESIARWMGIHPTGGRYTSCLARLRAEGYLEGYTLTEKGTAHARSNTTGIDAAKDALDSYHRKVFEQVLNLKKTNREGLAEALGIHPTGGRFTSSLAWLRDMGLIPERGIIESTEGAYR